jgi:beta-phosphoglucomutase
MKYKAIIFDFDGVLADTVQVHFLAWQRLFAEQKIHFTFDDYLTKANGQSRKATIQNVIPDVHEALLNVLTQKKDMHLDEARKQTPVTVSTGAKEFLDELKKQHIPLAVGSSSKSAKDYINLLNLQSYFSAIVTGHDIIHSKPHPEVFLLASERLGVPPKNCIVIEDSAAGVQAAHNAGMRTIGLLSSQDKAIAQLAHHVFPSMKAYKEILEIIL